VLWQGLAGIKIFGENRTPLAAKRAGA